MRRAHYLRDNKVSEYPQQAIWFDTESRFECPNDSTIYHRLKFGYACYMRRHRDGVWSDEQWIRFSTVAEFWDFVCSKVRVKTKLYVFCHNTSFDLPILDFLKQLPSRGFELISAIIDAPPTILRYRSDAGTIMILDTLNIWRMPLKFVGAEIGLEKLEMPDDNDLGVSWDSYGRRDVEIIRDACLRWWSFLESNDFGAFAPTLAGQSMRVFRHRYMVNKIYIDDNPKALKLTREGYHGARCECFYVGKAKGNFTLFDVNSMYPSVMANHQYPCKLVGHTRYATLTDLRNWLSQYCITARVLLRTHIPFAPVRNAMKLVFPIGEFECILSTPELVYAIEHCDILEVKECALYEKAYLFTTMMHDLFMKRITAKKEGKRVEAFMYRKLMNSFYGKWGQYGGKWDRQENIDDLSCKRWLEYDVVTDRLICHRQLGGLVQRKQPDEESPESFPAIAAHITAYARMKLWELITLAIPGNVLYCDTDSVLVNETGARNLQFLTDKEVMGKLSVKGLYTTIQIWGAKDYLFGDLARTKGVRKDAKWIDDHNIEQACWAGLRGLVASGQTDKPITKTIKKHLSRVYDKGIVLADGRVLPLEFLPE